jgi:hypothetical protein
VYNSWGIKAESVHATPSLKTKKTANIFMDFNGTGNLYPTK